MSEFSFQHLRFHLEPKAPCHMPVYNKGNVIRGGFGSTFRRIACHTNWAGRRRVASCEMCARTRRYFSRLCRRIPRRSARTGIFRAVAKYFPKKRELKANHGGDCQNPKQPSTVECEIAERRNPELFLGCEWAHAGVAR